MSVAIIATTSTHQDLEEEKHKNLPGSSMSRATRPQHITIKEAASPEVDKYYTIFVSVYCLCLTSLSLL